MFKFMLRQLSSFLAKRIAFFMLFGLYHCVGGRVRHFIVQRDERKNICFFTQNRTILH